MYKTAFHRIVWFPYRSEQKLMGPLLAALLLAVAAAGIVKTVDIFTSFISSRKAGSEPLLIGLVLCLCLAACINAARADYMSGSSAFFPCLVTVLTIVAVSLVLTAPQSALKLAVMQAGVSAFATLTLVGKFVQSGGVELGKIGGLYRRTTKRIRDTQRTGVDSPDFDKLRNQLVADVEELAKELEKAAPEVLASQLCNDVAKSLEEFIARSRLVDHDDFQRDLSEGSDALKVALERLNEGAAWR